MVIAGKVEKTIKKDEEAIDYFIKRGHISKTLNMLKIIATDNKGVKEKLIKPKNTKRKRSSIFKFRKLD